MARIPLGACAEPASRAQLWAWQIPV